MRIHSWIGGRQYYLCSSKNICSCMTSHYFHLWFGKGRPVGKNHVLVYSAADIKMRLMCFHHCYSMLMADLTISMVFPNNTWLARTLDKHEFLHHRCIRCGSGFDFIYIASFHFESVLFFERANIKSLESRCVIFEPFVKIIAKIWNLQISAWSLSRGGKSEEKLLVELAKDAWELSIEINTVVLIINLA